MDDVCDHLKEAAKALETAEVKLKQARSATVYLYRVIMGKCADMVTNAEDVKQGWSAINNTALYSLGVGTGVVMAVIGEAADGLIRLVFIWMKWRGRNWRNV